MFVRVRSCLVFFVWLLIREVFFFFLGFIRREEVERRWLGVILGELIYGGN